MLVALITGASSGIGQAAAVHLAGKGYGVCLSGRKEEALNETKKKCIEVGLKDEQILVYPGDVDVEAYCGKLIEATVAKFGKIDTLVNSAGILVNGAVIDTPIEEYDRQMLTNVRSLVFLTRIALPHIISSKGTIVNVSSVTGPCPFPGVTYYCMSKAAVDQFTKCLALEMAPHGVRVNAVNPGVIVTNVHRRAGQDEETYKQFLEKCKTTHALGRTGTVDEVAKAIHFLASSDSSFTTGELLTVDGGRHIMHPR